MRSYHMHMCYRPLVYHHQTPLPVIVTAAAAAPFNVTVSPHFSVYRHYMCAQKAKSFGNPCNHITLKLTIHIKYALIFSAMLIAHRPFRHIYYLPPDSIGNYSIQHDKPLRHITITTTIIYLLYLLSSRFAENIDVALGRVVSRWRLFEY